MSLPVAVPVSKGLVGVIPTTNSKFSNPVLWEALEDSYLPSSRGMGFRL